MLASNIIIATKFFVVIINTCIFYKNSSRIPQKQELFWAWSLSYLLPVAHRIHMDHSSRESRNQKIQYNHLLTITETGKGWKFLHNTTSKGWVMRSLCIMIWLNCKYWRLVKITFSFEQGLRPRNFGGKDFSCFSEGTSSFCSLYTVHAVYLQPHWLIRLFIVLKRFSHNFEQTSYVNIETSMKYMWWQSVSVLKNSSLTVQQFS